MMSFRPDRVVDAYGHRKDAAKHTHGVFCDCRPVLHWEEDRELLIISHQDPPPED